VEVVKARDQTILLQREKIDKMNAEIVSCTQYPMLGYNDCADRVQRELKGQLSESFGILVPASQEQSKPSAAPVLTGKRAAMKRALSGINENNEDDELELSDEFDGVRDSVSPQARKKVTICSKKRK
jgi:hypothetical protein